MVTVTRNYQITIPHNLRKRFKISEGDIVDWVETDEGILLIKKKEMQSIEDLRKKSIKGQKKLRKIMNVKNSDELVKKLRKELNI